MNCILHKKKSTKSIGKKTQTLTKAKVGRPKVELDVELIERLSSVMCTTEDIARVCRCSKDTLERNYMEQMEYGRANARCSVRRKQYDVAMNDEHKAQGTMLVWLGKTELKQRETIEHAVKAEVSESSTGQAYIDEFKKVLDAFENGRKN